MSVDVKNIDNNMENKIQQQYERWLKRAEVDADLVAELRGMSEADIEDAFYRDLEFGTGGLRGVIGAGTNRMNIYTVGKATQGLAAYVNSISENPTVAIAYDSRIKSDTFAKHTAEILAANGVKVYIYKELAPVPMLSYAVRYLKCDAGVVITASHNPAKYNGYKAYWEDGAQLSLEQADVVYASICATDIFNGVKVSSMEEFEAKTDKIIYVSATPGDYELEKAENKVH